MSEPTFVIGGAQRSGTTTLYHLIDQHPEVYMAKPVWPEPKFFVRESLTAADRDEYLAKWFSSTHDAKAIGEKSTSYLETIGSAERMKRWFPNMKAVFILRNPIERAISNYRYSRKNGLEKESLDFALRNEKTRVESQRFPGVSGHPFAYVRRGRFIEFLDQYLQAFPREQLLILLNDDLESRPEQTCHEIYQFLGVDVDYKPSRLHERHNVHVPDDLRLSRETLDWLMEEFREPNRRLAEVLARDLSRWNCPTKSVLQLVDEPKA
ncbi:MAG: sulfotransferase [Planctomycetota bacterium]